MGFFDSEEDFLNMSGETDAQGLVELAKLIRKFQEKSRISQAVGFKIAIGERAPFEITSDADRRLQEKVDPNQVSIKVVTTAQAG